MSTFTVRNIEGEKWGANSILRKIDDGFYSYTCTVINIDKTYTTSHAFVYDSNFKLFREEKWLWCYY